jgi:hypothetical protein
MLRKTGQQLLGRIALQVDFIRSLVRNRTLRAVSSLQRWLRNRSNGLFLFQKENVEAPVRGAF